MKMDIKRKARTLIATIVFLGSMVLSAQQRTGNIVEYFGKEKVEEINEGVVLHLFQKGWALQIQDFGIDSSTFPKDPVFQQALADPEYDITSNKIFGIDALGNEQRWVPIEADSTNSFSGRGLRSAYVYLTYRSNTEKIALFEGSGHSLVTINGLPHEGDHYDFGWSLIPIKLKKGINVFVLKVGRFSRVRARLLDAHAPVQFTKRDLTMPDLLWEENKSYNGAVRIINASNDWLENHTVNVRLGSGEASTEIEAIPPLSVQKIPFAIPSVALDSASKSMDLEVNLIGKNGNSVDATTIPVNLKSKYKHHKKTFVSAVDGSIQYYSVAPATNRTKDSLALFLSVHGASVEAVNQANAYKQKEWGNLVAPTNRRPYGYAWEDLGRLDALEVLEDAKKIFLPNPRKIYLTGHSMGGHGTWYLGATYPDQFAAIAPCAGYPDLLKYRDGFRNRLLEMSEERRKRFGITEKQLELMTFEPTATPLEKIVERAGSPSRTLDLIRNYLHHGVYVLHGEKDNVVPTALARDMRERLGKFHSDFTYYEYPGGTHWYGNHSVDWSPIFDFFQRHTIPEAHTIDKLEFSTGSPGVSAKSHFITIHQQQKPFVKSTFDFSKDDTKAFVQTSNIELLEVDVTPFSQAVDSIYIDEQPFAVLNQKNLFFSKISGNWKTVSAPSLKEKGPHRNGGFKDAFRNNVVFVYATKGSTEENEWYFNKARFDAETFWYRANGSVELVKDVDFKPGNYPNRNVVLYGNKSNNSAWGKLLKNCPVQVVNGAIDFGKTKVKGDQWGLYFVFPREDSTKASIGVVTASGVKGMKAAYANHYLVNGTTFPDFMLFDQSVLPNGIGGVKSAGFFGNDWSIENGDFEWKQ
ncbi:prolyl oligopeptidase family serine peptidase [uncultured Kriegella sp.]|uniref:carboxylesterase family protein n=1 Tax=uncultured Kriegella sp. TaxID=1798910 RepID=UPI0030DC4934|tara:strand:+ start:95 stop:2686 length:2592 start_codon:yes stop_codon:yes gene_type:complete